MFFTMPMKSVTVISFAALFPIPSIGLSTGYKDVDVDEGIFKGEFKKKEKNLKQIKNKKNNNTDFCHIRPKW